MRVAFFADDASASHAALLASSVLDRHPEDSGLGFFAGSARIADAVPDLIAAAAENGRHLMIALPLSQLGNREIRSRVDPRS